MKFYTTHLPTTLTSCHEKLLLLLWIQDNNDWSPTRVGLLLPGQGRIPFCLIVVV